jgi:hypothetical protein
MLPLIFVVESIFTQGPGKLSDCPGYLTLLVYILLFRQLLRLEIAAS